MNYQLIDPIIFQWAQSHSFRISTSYKDEEVRSIDIINAKGERFQVWFDIPTKHHVGIHVWNYKKKKESLKKEWLVNIVDLESILTEVFKIVSS